MRICLVNEYFPPFVPGGAEWSTEALARALAANGHEVAVVTPNWGAAARESRDGFTVIRFPFPRKLSPGRRTAPAKWLANPLFYLYAAAAIWRIGRQVRAEVIHVQNKHTLIPGVLAARALRIPVLLTIRDGSIIDAAPMCLHKGEQRPADCGVRKLWRECSEEYFNTYGGGRRLRTKIAFLYLWLDSLLRQRFLRRLDCVVGVSDGIREIYRRSGLLAGVRRHETVYSLPPSSLPPSPADVAEMRERLGLGGRRVILYVGKRSVGKGTRDLVSAIDPVVQRVPDAVFLFVGEGEPIAERPHVRSLGALPNKDVLALYPLADVVVVPSVIPEALNRVIIEAMAAGRPVVATRIGGNPELVRSGETGLLVERHKPDELARAIERVLTEPRLRLALGEAARRRAEEHLNPHASLKRLATLYEDAIVSASTRR